MALVDHVAAGFGMLAVNEAVSARQDAAADAVARLEDGDRRTQGRQVPGGDEAGQTGARHENGHAAQAVVGNHTATLFGNADRLGQTFPGVHRAWPVNGLMSFDRVRSLQGRISS